MTVSTPDIPVINSLKDIGSRYQCWLVDVWGVMHNGRDAFPAAVAATHTFREKGGIVVLLSNSPRPTPTFQEQLRGLGVPDDAYDAIVTSGDLTRHELRKRAGARVFHIGPDRDRSIFDSLDLALADPEDAELVVCSNLFDDETETPDDYGDLLRNLAARELPMICANPDHQVERGSDLFYCAGALAAIYEKVGGNVLYAGKPFAPIYDLALEAITSLSGRTVRREDVLAIGDGVNTDIAGAGNLDIDAVFVASGVHVPHPGTEGPKSPRIAELFVNARRQPLAITNALAW